jgi:hypothetical protein
MLDEPDYAPVQRAKNFWEVIKFDAHHKRYEQTYEVRKLADRWYCNCPAKIPNCKHIQIVKDAINPSKSKKDMF